jgi:hypothetical protein
VADHAELIEQVIQFDHNLSDRFPGDDHLGDGEDSIAHHLGCHNIAGLTYRPELGSHFDDLPVLVSTACTAPATMSRVSNTSSPVTAHRQSADQIHPMTPSGTAASPDTSTTVAVGWPLGFRCTPLGGMAKVSVSSLLRGAITRPVWRMGVG